ncbi:MAG TPA: tRNA lysidine(34) synthetase TilS [Cyanobacteria bacterium UBA8530]|nr:tRNA lysidine(34) synthetase TilS [Cyanobacteria bacterium UBA8530]
MPDFLKEFEAFLDSHLFLPEKARILVGFSGGADSTALLDLLNRLAPARGWAIAAASVDHSLRPESAREIESLKGIVENFGLPFFTRKIQLTAKGSIEAAAREARYAALNEVASLFSFDFLALGHQADDQLETILLRLTRGAALTGLRGIPLSREQSNGPKIIRPLLSFTRERVERYCLFRGLSTLSDPTNSEAIFSRNKVRLEVVPALRELNPRIAEVAARNALILAEEDDFLDLLAKKEFAKMVVRRETGLSLDIPKIIALPVVLARRVMALALSELLGGHRLFTSAHVGRLLVLVGKGGKIDLLAGIEASVRFGRLFLREKNFLSPVAMERNGEFVGGGWRIETILSSSENPPFSLDSFSVAFDLDRLPEGLVWRKEGVKDRFSPWGHEKSHPLNRFLTRSRVDPIGRAQLLVLASGEEVFWVVGLRRSTLAPVTPFSRRILFLKASSV